MEDKANDETLAYPLQLSKRCLLTIRDDNAFISPIAIEAAFHSLALPNKASTEQFKPNLPLRFSNYFILNKNSVQSLRDDLNEEATKGFRTAFHLHTPADLDERKTLLNHLSEQQPFPLSAKVLSQITIESMTLITCAFLTFRPWKSEHWEQLWSLKFHSNIHLSTETDFYFTKGFFRVAFHPTFQKIEIPGQIVDGMQMKLIILLPRCSSDLIHLYANINEYLTLPFSSAFIGVCLPKIAMDTDMNLTEALKNLHSELNPDNFGERNEDVHLSAAYSFGHFVLDMAVDPVQQPSSSCVHSIDLSPVTPWVFFANRPFLFLITYDDDYLMVGQMLGTNIRQETKQMVSKLNKKSPE